MEWFFGSYAATAEPTAGQKRWEGLQANEDDSPEQETAFASLFGLGTQQDENNQGQIPEDDPFLAGPGPLGAAAGAPSAIRGVRPPLTPSLSMTEAPRPKRTGKGLQAWEVDDDVGDDLDNGENAEADATRWTPFLPRDETIATDKAEARVKNVVEKDFEQVAGGGGQSELASYEEQVLGMAPVTAKVKHAMTVSTGDGDGDDPVQKPPEEGFSSSDDDDRTAYELRNPRDAAAQEGCTFVELPFNGAWSTSDDANWTSGGETAVLSGEGDSMACYMEEQFDDFDIEAMIKLDQGDHAGLIFRNAGEGHFSALCLNFRDMRVELRSTHDCTILGAAALKRGRWHQVRVRATGSTLMFFLNYKQVGQVLSWGVGDLVYCHSLMQDVCRIVRVHNDGSYVIAPWSSLDEKPDGAVEKTAPPTSLDSVAGMVGLWSSNSTAKIKGIVVARLHEITHNLRRHYERMQQEREELDREAKMVQAGLMRKTKAAKLIQEMGKLTLGFNRMRMQVYKQAEEQGRDDLVREKKLLTWFALLSVFAKINQEMAKPAKMEQRNRQYLDMLDRYHPPPPPPPLRDPPQAADEELHYRYEERRQKYAQQWERAGKMIYGQDKFDSKIRTMENGPAQRQKHLIAQTCFDKAKGVTSEAEHQEFLRKAWRLENDWASLDDATAGAEFERWREEKMGIPAPKRKATYKPPGRARTAA